MGDENDAGGGRYVSRAGTTHVVGEIEPFDPTASIEVAARTLRTLGKPFALIGGLALEAWGIPRATKDVDFAVPHGAAEPAAEAMAPTTKSRPLRIGGVGVRDAARNLRIDLIDRRFQLARFFRDAVEEAEASGRVAKIADIQVPLGQKKKVPEEEGARPVCKLACTCAGNHSVSRVDSLIVPVHARYGACHNELQRPFPR